MITTVHIAPGVYVRVVPLSDETPQNLRPNLYALFLFTSEKGPSNEVVFVPNRDTALRLFGNPDPRRDRGLLYLLNYVDTVPAYAVRLAPNDATIANAAIALVPVIDPNTGQPAQDADGKYVFTFKFVYGNLTQDIKYSGNVVRWKPDDPSTELSVVTDIVPGDITDASVAYILGIFAGKGVGEYYNNYAFTFALSQTNPNIVHMEQVENIQTNPEIINVFESVSILNYVDDIGYQRRIDYIINDDNTSPVQYLPNDVVEEWLKGNVIGPTNIVVQYMDSSDNFNWTTKAITDIANINTADILVTALNNYAADMGLAPGTVYIQLRNGSEGSLWQDGRFSWQVFNQMVVDALRGTTNVLPDIITELVVEDSIRIKYVFDPTDERTRQIDPDGYNAVKVALRDFVRMKWEANAGAIAILDEGPINNVGSAEHVVQDFLCTSYISYSNTAIPEFNSISRISHLYHVAKDLPRARVQQGYYIPFAGIDAALHSGIKNLVKEYTIDERDVLTEKGFNYIIRDEYGYYTDLDRTTNPVKNPLTWLYIVEMLVDIKWEVAHLCKPWKHRLETAQWDRLKQIITEYVLKPRIDAGYITEFDVKLILDKKYIDQNLVPIEIAIRPAREIERIVITIYVR